MTAIGHSAALGTYVMLRDVYGDVFTYARARQRRPDLCAPQGRLRRRPAPRDRSGKHERADAEGGRERRHAARRHAPGQELAARRAPPSRSGQVAIAPVGNEGVPAGMGRVRLYAHPGNPDARAAAAVRAAERARSANSAPPPASASRLGLAGGHRPRSRASSRAQAPAVTCASRSSPRETRPAIEPRPGARQLGAAAGRAAPAGREGDQPAARRHRERRAAALAVPARACRALRPRNPDLRVRPTRHRRRRRRTAACSP